MALDIIADSEKCILELMENATWEVGQAKLEKGALFPELTQWVRAGKEREIRGAIEYFSFYLESPEVDERGMRESFTRVNALLKLAQEAMRWPAQETPRQGEAQGQLSFIDQIGGRWEELFRAVPSIVSGKAPCNQAESWHKAWVAGCLHFLKNGGSAQRVLKIPVAASVDEQSTGLIATLRLELLDVKFTGAFQHPQDWHTCLNPDFHAAMLTAWNAATSGFAGDHPSSAACWRLLDRQGSPLTRFGGNSVGGAAALGWHHLYHGTLPDAELIVLAAIDARGELSGVDGIPEKVRAILRDGRFDTIVVGSEENLEQAQQELARQNVPEEVLRVGLPEQLLAL